MFPECFPGVFRVRVFTERFRRTLAIPGRIWSVSWVGYARLLRGASFFSQKHSCARFPTVLRMFPDRVSSLELPVKLLYTIIVAIFGL